MLQHENITIAATEVIGAVCRHLSWPAYVYYLKHFIHVLQSGQVNQKLGVRYSQLCLSLTRNLGFASRIGLCEVAAKTRCLGVVTECHVRVPSPFIDDVANQRVSLSFLTVCW